ncbi:Hypothetical protein UVM_LOCUS302 [uncultured virus]|nr:Hypothetical protein UVM_LOCUS302 [uncultured virus]
MEIKVEDYKKRVLLRATEVTRTLDLDPDGTEWERRIRSIPLEELKRRALAAKARLSAEQDWLEWSVVQEAIAQRIAATGSAFERELLQRLLASNGAAS